ncbi:MAG: DNA (cytosine-5-)-methyltransferase [Oscillospiraceae bacterium]|nr:DNA (cytosine-5-)-methyltransferase [Oscillospiraceae bacterium]
MTFLDFFAGTGGFRKGLEQAGMTCVGHCEIDKFAERSYRAIFKIGGDEWFADDIMAVLPADLPRANLWCAGFPCQDISVANATRPGLDGTRSGLFFEVIRLLDGLACETRPEWLVFENVRALLEIHGGWDLFRILHSLAERGYHCEYGVLDSSRFGVPQHRRRVFIVARRHIGAGCTRKTFPVPAGHGKTLWQLNERTSQGKRIYDADGISATLTAQGGNFAGKTGLYFVDLTTGRPRLTEHSRCLTTRIDGGVGKRKAERSGVFAGGRVRKLTPREAWRLQGWPDDDFDKAAAVNSDAQLYRQAGNGVTVNVVAAIGRQIMLAQEAYEE